MTDVGEVDVPDTVGRLGHVDPERGCRVPLVLEDGEDGSKRSIPLYLIHKPAPVSNSFMVNHSDHRP